MRGFWLIRNYGNVKSWFVHGVYEIPLVSLKKAGSKLRRVLLGKGWLISHHQRKVSKTVVNQQGSRSWSLAWRTKRWRIQWLVGGWTKAFGDPKDAILAHLFFPHLFCEGPKSRIPMGNEKAPGVAREKLLRWSHPPNPSHLLGHSPGHHSQRWQSSQTDRLSEKSGFQPFLVVVSIPNAMGRLQQYLFLDLANMFLGIKNTGKLYEIYGWYGIGKKNIIDKDPWKSPSLLKTWKIFDSLDDPT